MTTLATVALALTAAGVAFMAGSRTTSKDTAKPGYDYTAAVMPLRTTAVAQYKAAFNIDPNTALDPDAALKAGNAVIAQIQTSWNDVELQALADSLAIRGTTLSFNGYPSVGQAYTDAAKAITDLAMAVKARNAAIGTAGTAAVAGGSGGRVHAPFARRRLQLHTTRGR